MEENQAFLIFGCGEFKLRKWKEIVQKVIDITSKAGCKFQSFDITDYPLCGISSISEIYWKNKRHLLKELEEEAEVHFKEKEDWDVEICGKFLRYYIDLDFIFYTKERKFIFLIIGKDPRWAKISSKNKLKVFKLLNKISEVLKVRIEECNVKPPRNAKVTVRRYGCWVTLPRLFLLNKKCKSANTY
jgi:hypothetical protein